MQNSRKFLALRKRINERSKLLTITQTGIIAQLHFHLCQK